MFLMKLSVALYLILGRVAQSVQRLATGWMSGIESRWRRDFPLVQTGPGAHPASCKMGTGSFPGVKCGWGVLLTVHPLLVPRSWKSRSWFYPHFGPHRDYNTLPFYCISFENKPKIYETSPRLLASFKEVHEKMLKGITKMYYDLSSQITEEVYMTSRSGVCSS